MTRTFGILIDEKLKAINGLFLGNKGRGVIRYLLKIVDVLRVHRTASDVKLITTFAFWVINLCNKQGIKGTVIHLKVCQVLVQQACGGYRVDDLGPLKRRVRRSRTGFPTVIPTYQRLLLRQGDAHAIRLWLSLFGIYRILKYTGQVNLSTITDPGVDIPGDWLLGWDMFVEKEFFPALRAHLPGAVLKDMQRKYPLPIPFPIMKSGPTTTVRVLSGYEDLLDENGKPLESFGSSSLVALACSAKLWLSNPLFRTLYEYLDIISGRSLINRLQWAGTELFQSTPYTPKGFVLGKLAVKEEAAGKMRIFAMVDAWTQWVLKPLHDLIFQILPHVEEDGTFDQPKPAEKLKDYLLRRKLNNLPVWVYSIDLSAATDRLPVRLQKSVIAGVYSIFGFGFWKDVSLKLATLWADLLVGRQYVLRWTTHEVIKAPRVILPSSGIKVIKGSDSKQKVKHEEFVTYAVGQPMGALSSWASLALTHHAIIQFAYDMIQKERGQRYHWFSRYAVLGDDVIIGDRRVAKSYLGILDTIGVGAGLAKSLVSRNKIVMEFAKKFWAPERNDQVSLKELVSMLISIRLSVELIRKYKVTWQQLCRFYGIGYKVLSRGDSIYWDLPNRLKIPWIWATKPLGSWAKDDTTWFTWLSSSTINGGVLQSTFSEQTWDLVLKNIAVTRTELQVRYEKLRKEIEEVNRADPRTYTGIVAFDGDELFLRKALSIYNSMESEPQIAQGQDEVANPVGWNRMLGSLWGNVAPEFIRPEIREREEPIFPVAAVVPPRSKGPSQKEVILDMNDIMSMFQSMEDGGFDSYSHQRSILSTLWGEEITDVDSEYVTEILRVRIEEVIQLDDMLGTLDFRAPQHRSDEENEFNDSIQWFSRWKFWSAPLWEADRIISGLPLDNNTNAGSVDSVEGEEWDQTLYLEVWRDDSSRTWVDYFPQGLSDFREWGVVVYQCLITSLTCIPQPPKFLGTSDFFTPNLLKNKPSLWSKMKREWNLFLISVEIVIVILANVDCDVNDLYPVIQDDLPLTEVTDKGWKGPLLFGLGFLFLLFLPSIVTLTIDSWTLASNYSDPAIRPLLLPTLSDTPRYFPLEDLGTVQEIVRNLPSRGETLGNTIITPQSPMHMHGFWE